MDLLDFEKIFRQLDAEQGKTRKKVVVVEPEPIPYKAVIAGYDPSGWISEIAKFKPDELSAENKEYYEAVVHSLAVYLGISAKGISLRHLKSSFESHNGTVNLDRLKIDSWRTFIISVRDYVTLYVHVETAEIFVFPSAAARDKCPNTSHLQSMIIATPNNKCDPKLQKLKPIDMKLAFSDGLLDMVDGALVDARVPNQTAQVATKEDIEAKIRPPVVKPGKQMDWSKSRGKGKAKAKLTFEEQIAPKPKREVTTAVTLEPTEKNLSPEVADSNMEQMLAKAQAKAEREAKEKEEERQRLECESESRRPVQGGGPEGRRTYIPVKQKSGPSDFFKKFKAGKVHIAPVPCTSEEERVAGRQATQYRETEFEIKTREQQEREEAEQKKLKEEEERRSRQEEEERQRGLRQAELAVQEKERQRKKEEEEEAKARKKYEEMEALKRSWQELRAKKEKEEKQRAEMMLIMERQEAERQRQRRIKEEEEEESKRRLKEEEEKAMEQKRVEDLQNKIRELLRAKEEEEAREAEKAAREAEEARMAAAAERAAREAEEARMAAAAERAAREAEEARMAAAAERAAREAEEARVAAAAEKSKEEAEKLKRIQQERAARAKRAEEAMRLLKIQEERASRAERAQQAMKELGLA